MKSRLLRYAPLIIFWLASFGIVLHFHSPLTTFAFFTLLLFVVGGAFLTIALLQPLPARLLWRFYAALAVCWVADIVFIKMVGKDTTMLVFGGIPFACLLVPAAVMSSLFAPTSRDTWWRAAVAAMCFMTSCLPVLVVGTLLLIA